MRSARLVQARPRERKQARRSRAVLAKFSAGPSLTAFALAQPYVRLGDEGRSIEESGIRVPLGLAYRHRFPVPRGRALLGCGTWPTRCPRGRAIGIFSNRSLPADKSHYQKSFTFFLETYPKK